MAKYNYDKKENTYLTPPTLIDRALQLLSMETGQVFNERFDLDVCCNDKNVPANNYYMYPEHNGLFEDWMRYNYCNPPFDQCRKWVQKAYYEQTKGNTTIMLIPARTETAYWHKYILNKQNVDIHFLRKGFKFINPETHKEMGVFKNALAFVVFRGDSLEKELNL